MTNSLSLSIENLPQKFIHQIMKSQFDNNIYYSNGGQIIIRKNNINIIIICVKTNEPLRIEQLNNMTCNTPTYYTIFNLGRYFVNINELENIDPIIEEEFLNIVERMQIFIDSILNFDYHPKRNIVTRLDCSNY